ncbi:protein kinase [Candidatus Uabimicrobium sp. HlEnr_7]|uniref:serine/threonine-protein kinase n=1 Tax=Candidatus Uabimicrobium helgolandensis TaxID=3095367 RepID=UPI0035584CAD
MKFDKDFLLLLRGYYKEAKTIYEQKIADEPNDPNHLFNGFCSFVYFGRELPNPKRDKIFKQALEYYFKSVELDPEYQLFNKRYTIKEIIGAGGMGVVFRVYDTKLDFDKAIKVFKPHEINITKCDKDRFISEAKMVQRMEDQRIVKIFDLSLDPLYMVMEYIQGKNLKECVQEFTTDEKYDIALNIAIGINVCHSYGVIHRDIKPSNILIKNGNIKIIDFGIAKSSSCNSLTETGLSLGTAKYIAPEIREEAKEANFVSDIFSYGRTLIYLFSEDCIDIEKCPKKIQKLLKKLTKNSPEKRYQSMSQFLDDFGKLQRKKTRIIYLVSAFAAFFLLFSFFFEIELNQTLPQNISKSQILRFKNIHNSWGLESNLEGFENFTSERIYKLLIQLDEFTGIKVTSEKPKKINNIWFEKHLKMLEKMQWR